MIPPLPASDALISMAVGLGLVMVRIGSLFITAPMFNSQTIPVAIRGAIIAIISLAIYASLPASSDVTLEAPTLILATLGELCIGAAAGLTAQLVFAAVDGAGRLMGMPMGLGFAQAVDPMTGLGTVVTSRFLGVIVTMMFLALDIHLLLIRLLVKSFYALPPGHVMLSSIAGKTLATKAGLIFVGTVQLAAPVLLVLLGVMAALGLLAKVAPKVNLFVLSFAISISLGIVALRASLPNLSVWIRDALLRVEPMTAQVIGGF
ncbi:MAG: flagellar biosynthetic protein FliR [Myxococcota bacterium]|nr:flagellar biosynthetic protein FliR [Myxococcota bacterium]